MTRGTCFRGKISFVSCPYLQRSAFAARSLPTKRETLFHTSSTFEGSDPLIRPTLPTTQRTLPATLAASLPIQTTQILPYGEHGLHHHHPACAGDLLLLGLLPTFMSPSESWCPYLLTVELPLDPLPPGHIQPPDPVRLDHADALVHLVESYPVDVLVQSHPHRYNHPRMRPPFQVDADDTDLRV